jgi:hypothetical protein
MSHVSQRRTSRSSCELPNLAISGSRHRRERRAVTCRGPAHAERMPGRVEKHHSTVAVTGLESGSLAPSSRQRATASATWSTSRSMWRRLGAAGSGQLGGSQPSTRPKRMLVCRPCSQPTRPGNESCPTPGPDSRTRPGRQGWRNPCPPSTKSRTRTWTSLYGQQRATYGPHPVRDGFCSVRPGQAAAKRMILLGRPAHTSMTCSRGACQPRASSIRHLTSAPAPQPRHLSVKAPGRSRLTWPGAEGAGK